MPLTLSVAIGDYDRNRPLIDKRVTIDGVEAVIMTLSPEEMFFRAMRQEAFDICELSLSSFSLRRARGDCPYVGVPAFLSRAFRHTSMIVRRGAGINSPKDLEGPALPLATPPSGRRYRRRPRPDLDWEKEPRSCDPSSPES